MRANEVAKLVMHVAFPIHQRRGPGLLESVYEVVRLAVGFRADLIAEHGLNVGRKSVEQIHPVHKKRRLTDRHLADCRLGLLLNF